jgi:hypothetical protein
VLEQLVLEQLVLEQLVLEQLVLEQMALEQKLFEQNSQSPVQEFFSHSSKKNSFLILSKNLVRKNNLIKEASRDSIFFLPSCYKQGHSYKTFIGTMTFDIMTFGIMTSSIMDLIVTLSINCLQHNDSQYKNWGS